MMNVMAQNPCPIFPDPVLAPARKDVKVLLEMSVDLSKKWAFIWHDLAHS